MEPISLQERFLGALQDQAIVATFFLVNGFQFKGTLTAFDKNVLVVESGGAQEMIYKHAVSTIVPSRPVDLAS